MINVNKLNYNFFDYKYNIVGYSGQHFGSIYQYIYLIGSIIIMILLLFFLRKMSKKRVLSIIQITSVFLIAFYLVKTIWESVYDIKLTGSFNTGLLPFDTCSIIMLASLLSGFGKGKIKELADSWLVTGGIVGGLGTMVSLNAFKYYPFFSFGAFYSMIWHFLMVFLGLLLIVNHSIEFKYSTIIRGFFFHIIISLVVIPIDYLFNFDFMMYKNLGGIPFFEDIGSYYTSINLPILNTLIMLVLYFLAFNIVFGIPLVINKKKYSHLCE